MGRGSLVLGTAALLGLGAAEASASWWSIDYDDHRNWKIALAGGAFFPEIDGSVGVDTALGDASVDVDTLDLEGETSAWGEVDLQLFQKQHLRFVYLPIDFEGDTVLGAPIRFGGSTFEAADRVTSRVKLDTYELSYRYDIYLGKRVTLSPLVQVSLLDARVEGADETLGLRYEESELVPVPALGLHAEVYPLARIGLFAEGKGLTIGHEATAWDVQGGIRLHLLKYLQLMGSYRVVDYDVDYLGVRFDLQTAGPHVGATLLF